jgi:signal transduction histidine kinase
MKTTENSRRPEEPGPRTAPDVARLQRTLEAAKLLQSTLDLKQLTSIILEIIRNEVPVDRVTAFTLDRKHNLLYSLVAQGVDSLTISMPVDNGIAGFVAKTRKVLDVLDAYSDSRFNPEFDRSLKYRTRDIFALPVLNNNGEVAGVLELLNRKRPITPQDMEFLQDISVFVGVALENAWLHEEVRNKAQLEEELTRSRERLVQMDRLALISEVLSTVASQLTSPLSTMTKQAALMKRDPGMTPAMLRYVEIMEAAGTSSTEAVSNFVNFIQKQVGERAAVDLTQLVRQTIAVRATHWAWDRIEVKQDLQLTPYVIVNDAEIQHAVMNLIRNAEDAMIDKAGPRVLTIRTFYDSFQNTVAIEIRDNGVGIPAQHNERIFEAFFSTKRNAGRTGLGLTIANRIIREHRGAILLETTEGRGAVFTIELPVVQSD